MKKIAAIVVFVIGLTLVSLNYYGEQNQQNSSSLAPQKMTLTTEKVLLEEDNSSQESPRLNIPSIFSALLRLL
tara:strand:+ start:24708 stop:24926 length:219 start_codon:yes stop_codon:yes gene_type:complete